MEAGSLARDWKFWIVTVLGAVCLAAALANVVLESRTLERQAEVRGRQQFINESRALSRLHGQLIQTLAKLSAQSNDEAIKAMLAKHGVTFTVNAPAGATPAPPAAGAP